MFGLVFHSRILHDSEFRSLESASPRVFIESVISFVTCLEFITLKISYQHRVDDTCFDLRRTCEVSDALLPRTPSRFLMVGKSTLFLTLRRLMSYIYGAPILDVSRSHTTTQHSR